MHICLSTLNKTCETYMIVSGHPEICTKISSTVHNELLGKT